MSTQNLYTPFTPSNPRDAGSHIEIPQSFPFDQWEDFDYLKTKYPRFAPIIQEARNKGARNDQIERYISTRIEPRMNFFANGEQTNKYLGRTPQSMQTVADYEHARRTQTLQTAHPDKTPDDIYNAIELERIYGIDATHFLSNQKVFDAFTKDKKLRESWLDTAKRSANNFIVSRKIGQVGEQFLRGVISKDEALNQQAELQKSIISEPLIQTPMGQTIGGATAIITQGLDTSWQSLLLSGGLAAVGGAAGSLTGPGGAALGAKVGSRVGYTLGNARQLWALAAGNAMLELSQLKDENGNPIDENAARGGAILEGLITIGAEFGLGRPLMKTLGLDKIKGIDSLFNLSGLNRQAIIDAFTTNPLLRDAIIKLGKDFANNVNLSAINNTIETLGHDLAISTAKAISNQPFPTRSWPEAIHSNTQSAADTYLRSIRDFTAAGLPRLGLQAFQANRYYNNVQKPAIQTMANMLGVSEADAEKEIAATIQQQQIQDNQQKDIQRAKKFGEPVPEITTPQENTTPQVDSSQTQQPQQQAQPQEQIQQVNPKYVFIPREQFLAFAEQNLNVAPEQIITTGDEVALSFEQYSLLRQQFPDFIKSVLGDVRYDADGLTPNEAAQKVIATDQATAEQFHSDDTQKFIQQETQRFVDAGETQEKAETLGQLLGALDASAVANHGVHLSAREIVTSDQLAQQRADMSRLDANYDIKNPDTWPDQLRAQQFQKALQSEGLTPNEQYIKQLLEAVTGKKYSQQDNQAAQDLESLQDENRETVSRIIRSEVADFKRTLRNANLDAIQAMQTRSDLDTEQYDANSRMPKGKSRNPDASYEFGDSYDGKTKIDFATNNQDLTVRVKTPGNRNPLTLSIKDFRNADLTAIITDLADGVTAFNVPLDSTPAVKNLITSLVDFWKTQGLDTVTVSKTNDTQLDLPQGAHSGTAQLDLPQGAYSMQDELQAGTHKSNGQDLVVEQPNVNQLDLSQYDQIEQPNVVHPDVMDDTAVNIIWDTFEGQPGMSPKAKRNLYQDEAAWIPIVEDVWTDPNVSTRTTQLVPVLRYTPQVLTLAGAENLPVYIEKSKIRKISRDHPGMDDTMVKQIPRAIADPIAIFESKSEGKHEAKVVLTEIKDSNGASVITAFHLDYDGKSKGHINKLASSYGKDAKVKDGIVPNNAWFADQVQDGRLLYIDKNKAVQWQNQTGVQIIPEQLPDGVKTRDDLVALWNQPEAREKGFYYTDPNTGEHVSVFSTKNGKAFIELLTGFNPQSSYAAHVHDIGHQLSHFMQDLAANGDLQMQDDFNTLMNKSGVDMQDWLADTNSERGGAREQFDEWFAKSWETYLMEGKAPTSKLQAVFDRIRKFMLEIYDSITQLGVTLDDDTRDIFNRLLTFSTDDDTVQDFADNDARRQRQIDADKITIRELAAQNSDLLATRNNATVSTVNGLNVDTRYRIVDSDQLIASHSNDGRPNPNFPQNLQPRQRNRIASIAQINNIAANLNPQLLGESSLASDGAPIVGSDLVVESGNGRVMALREAYNRGTAEKYREWLKQNAINFGIDPAAIDGMAHPVLVRERTSDVDRENFVREANVSSISVMSAAENAINDARLIDPNILIHYNFSKGFKDNKRFIMEVINKLPQNEQADLVDAKGNISNSGYNRVLFALAAKAYGGDESIINRLTEQFDDDVRNVSRALILAAPKMTGLEFSANGNPDYAIGQDIMQAVNILANLKDQGITVQEYLNQPAIIGDEEHSQVVNTLLDFFNRNSRSPNTMAQALVRYAETMADIVPSNNLTLFEQEPVDKLFVLQQAIKFAEGEEDAEVEGSIRIQNLKTISDEDTIRHRLEAVHKIQQQKLKESFARQQEKQKAEFHNTIQVLQQSHQKELQQANAPFVEQIAQLQEQIDFLNEQRDLDADWIDYLREAHSAELQEQQELDEASADFAHQADLEARDREFIDQIVQLEEQHQSEIEQLNAQQEQQRELYQQETKDLKQQHKSDLQVQRKELLRQKKQQLADLKKQQKAEIKALTQQHKKEISTLNAQQKASAKLAQKEIKAWEKFLFKKQKERLRIADEQARQVAKVQKTIAKNQRQIERLQQRVNTLSAQRKERSDKSAVRGMVRNIFRMSRGNNSIAYGRLQQIRELLNGYQLTKTNDEKLLQRRELIRDFLDTQALMDDIPQDMTDDQIAEAGLSQEDVDEFLNTIHIEEMTVKDVRNLHNKVKAIFNAGRREYEIWKKQRDKRRRNFSNAFSEQIIAKTKAPKERVPKSSEDIVKQNFWDMPVIYWNSVQTPGRFLEHLGEPFRRIIEDGFSEHRDRAYEHIHTREQNMLQGWSHLGVDINDFMNHAFSLDGQDYSWAEVMGIYLGAKNDKHLQAMLWGNFVKNDADRNSLYDTEEQGMHAINQILEFINQPENLKYKQAADLIIKDFDDNFDRINQARINDFNKGLNHEENYTPIFRLKHQTAQGFIDSQAEQLAAEGQHEKLIKKIADGFTISRQRISKQKQAPISLNVISNWFRGMTEQEFAANLGGYAADVMSAIFRPGKNGTVADLIKERYGKSHWDTLRSIINDSIIDSDNLELDAAGVVTSHFIKARSYAYVAWNLASALSQTASFFTALPYSNRAHLFRTLARALTLRGDFLESVFQKAPELRYTSGDPLDNSIRQNLRYSPAKIKNNAARSALNKARQGMAAGYAGVQTLDNWTKAMVFDAVYQARLDDGYSEEDAVRLARRAVLDTQPASTSREQPRILRSGGTTKLVFTQFMNSLMPLFNMSFVDIGRNLASKSRNGVKNVAWDIVAVGLSILAAGAIKDAFNGKLPTGEELPTGETDSLSKWLGETFWQNLLNTAPIFNKIFNSMRFFSNKSYRSEDRIVEPFIALRNVVKNLRDETPDKKPINAHDLLKSAALFGVPIPYGGLRPMLDWLNNNENR